MGYLCAVRRASGGNITGAPGYNAARVIAESLGMKPWWNPLDLKHTWRVEMRQLEYWSDGVMEYWGLDHHSNTPVLHYPRSGDVRLAGRVAIVTGGAAYWRGVLPQLLRRARLSSSPIFLME